MDQFRSTGEAFAKVSTPHHEKKADSDLYLDFIRSKKEGVTVSLPRIDIITADKKMLKLKDLVKQIADTNVPVLVTGESGSGKELIARSIHDSSNNRSSSQFVAVNCAAIPAHLLESELFGHEKGSFTGAIEKHIGKFEQASGGTLLLDEITEMAPALQAKLLRAIQEKEIERVGGNGAIKIDTRIVVTSNKDLKAAVAEGQFRQDLYYRLYVIHLEVPPLRERKDDIELLSKFYLKRFLAEFGRGPMQLTSEAVERLRRYPWPGNVRELQNIIQRAILMAQDDVITGADLPLSNGVKKANESWILALPIGRQMREVETHFIIETLKSHQGNRTHAAKTLGISLRTLRNKINEFNAMGFVVPSALQGKTL